MPERDVEVILRTATGGSALRRKILRASVACLPTGRELSKVPPTKSEGREILNTPIPASRKISRRAAHRSSCPPLKQLEQLFIVAGLYRLDQVGQDLVYGRGYIERLRLPDYGAVYEIYLCAALL